VGTLGIKAPEVELGDYDPACSDAFSCGVVLATLAIGAPPFVCADEADHSFREWEQLTKITSVRGRRAAVAAATAGRGKEWRGSEQATFWMKRIIAGRGRERRRRVITEQNGRKAGGGGGGGGRGARESGQEDVGMVGGYMGGGWGGAGCHCRPPRLIVDGGTSSPISGTTHVALHHVCEVIAGLLHPRPELRMTVDEALCHPWIVSGGGGAEEGGQGGQGGQGGRRGTGSVSQLELKRIMTVIRNKERQGGRPGRNRRS
jgi:serine/threonine protein kinase